MSFSLIYRGQLKSSQRSRKQDLNHLREQFHEQLQAIPRYEFDAGIMPILDSSGQLYVMRDELQFQRNGYDYIAAIAGQNLVVSLDVNLYSPMTQHRLIHNGGDLDNRAKTLLDSLRLPSETEAKNSWYPDAGPCWVLLEDDSIIRNISIQQEQILGQDDSRDVLAIVGVNVVF